MILIQDVAAHGLRHKRHKHYSTLTRTARKTFSSVSLGTGAQVSPVPIDTNAVAVLEMTVDPGLRFMKLNLKVHNARGITKGHLHCAPAGKTGPLITEFFEKETSVAVVNENSFSSSATLTGKDITGPTACGTNVASIFAAMKQGQVYLNVHTEKNPAGEVRGQIMLIPDVK